MLWRRLGPESPGTALITHKGKRFHHQWLMPGLGIKLSWSNSLETLQIFWWLASHYMLTASWVSSYPVHFISHYHPTYTLMVPQRSGVILTLFMYEMLWTEIFSLPLQFLTHPPAWHKLKARKLNQHAARVKSSRDPFIGWRVELKRFPEGDRALVCCRPEGSSRRWLVTDSNGFSCSTPGLDVPSSAFGWNNLCIAWFPCKSQQGVKSETRPIGLPSCGGLAVPHSPSEGFVQVGGGGEWAHNSASRKTGASGNKSKAVIGRHVSH